MVTNPFGKEVFYRVLVLTLDKVEPDEFIKPKAISFEDSLGMFVVIDEDNIFHTYFKNVIRKIIMQPPKNTKEVVNNDVRETQHA